MAADKFGNQLGVMNFLLELLDEGLTSIRLQGEPAVVLKCGTNCFATSGLNANKIKINSNISRGVLYCFA